MNTKKLTYFILMTLMSIGLFSCKKDDPVNNNTEASTNLVQYTPGQANWESFGTKPFQNGANIAHDPDGVKWITSEQWANAQWDGTIYNPSEMSAAAFYKAIFPSADVIRGLREVFYQHNPFKDVNNPTKAEVDEWHRIAINHVRALVGYTSEDRQVKKDHCMFSRALWGDQRMHTNMWDSEYSGTEGSAQGPCQNSSNAHCGASFVPNAADQAAYLPIDYAPCSSSQGGAEGISSAPKSNIPWSIKWVRAFGSFLQTEGFWGGHVGPWFHREKFGFSFWDSDVNYYDSNAILRAKWTGNLLPSLYVRP
jgi:hypothetical protein